MLANQPPDASSHYTAVKLPTHKCQRRPCMATPRTNTDYMASGLKRRDGPRTNGRWMSKAVAGVGNDGIGVNGRLGSGKGDASTHAAAVDGIKALHLVQEVVLDAVLRHECQRPRTGILIA